MQVLLFILFQEQKPIKMCEKKVITAIFSSLTSNLFCLELSVLSRHFDQ